MLNRNTLALVAFVAATFNVGAIAGTSWEAAHPCRARVNERLNHQNRRIDNEMKSGEIKSRQAVMLHTENRQIRVEARAMARQGGGYITKQGQRTLNQQENRLSTQIRYVRKVIPDLLGTD